jgi:hypothetical protein
MSEKPSLVLRSPRFQNVRTTSNKKRKTIIDKELKQLIRVVDDIQQPV